jgi:hypothetical protein
MAACAAATAKFVQRHGLQASRTLGGKYAVSSVGFGCYRVAATPGWASPDIAADLRRACVNAIAAAVGADEGIRCHPSGFSR